MVTAWVEWSGGWRIVLQQVMWVSRRSSTAHFCSKRLPRPPSVVAAVFPCRDRCRQTELVLDE